MGSALSADQLTAWRAQLAARLLPDTLDVQTPHEQRTSSGVLYTYTTDRAAVPCRIDPAQTVERQSGAITVTQTEYPIWFTTDTVPTRTQVLRAADGTRFQIIAVAPVTAWTGLVEVRAARIGGTSG